MIWYLSIALVISIISSVTFKENISKTLKIIFPSFIIIFIAPLTNLLFSGFLELQLLNEPATNPILWPMQQQTGILAGIILELSIIVVFYFTYSYLKKKSVLKSIISTSTILLFLIFWINLPNIIITFFDNFSIHYEITANFFLNSFLLVFIFISAMAYYTYNKAYFIRILKDIDLLRVAHYLTIMVIGYGIGLLAINEPFRLTSTSLFQLTLAPIAIIFAGVCSLVTNGIADINIDKISNPERALIKGKIPLSHFKQISIISAVFAIVYSLSIDYISFLLIILVIANYHIYSSPPLRMKKIFFFSKFFIALNTYALMILGYYYVTGSILFPYQNAIAFLLGFTAFINFIDLKDYKGDKFEGIKTIPTVLGLRKAKIILGLFFLIGYIGFGLFLQNTILLIFMIPTGLFQFFLINKKNYKEQYVFSLYVLTLIVVFYFILNKSVIIHGI